MKIRITENQEDTSGNRGHSRSELDLLLTPKNGSTVEEIEQALNNRDFYGPYLINIRDKMSVNKAIEDHFGPTLPIKKRSLEKERGVPFPPKTKQAMDDFIKNLGGDKPGILTWEIKPNGTIIFPSKKNESQQKTSNVLKQVLGAAGIKYKLEHFENLAEYSKSLQEVKRMQTLAGLKEIKVEDPTRLAKYKEAAIVDFSKLREEDKDESYDNNEFYDKLIHGIRNSKSIDEINQIVFKEFFFEDDVDGMEDFKIDMENTINNM